MKRVLFFIIIISSFSCLFGQRTNVKANYSVVDNTVTLNINNGKLGISVIGDEIMQVRFTNAKSFSTKKSLFIEPQIIKPKFKVSENKEELSISTEKMLAKVDLKSGKVVFFDKNGKIVIPAIYNDARDFHNGIAMIMKDGVRKCWKENNGKQPEYPNCEHWSWEGKTIMINTNNQELFEIPKENFTNSIDYNNVYKNFKLNENVDSDIYTSYKGNDGNIYSFYSPEKDFKKWFETKFLPDFKTNGKILEKYFNNSVELQIKKSSIIIDNKDFLTKGFDKKINKLLEDYIKNKYSIDYFNEDSREISIDLRLTSIIQNKDIRSATNFNQKSIIFKKIRDSFYIISTP